MRKSDQASSSEVSQTEVDTSTGVTSETLYVQKFQGGELIYSSHKEYGTFESANCDFTEVAQEVELPAVSQRTESRSRSSSRTRSVTVSPRPTSPKPASPQPSTSRTLTKAEKKMAKTKRTLNRVQKPIFLKDGFTQQLADEVRKQKSAMDNCRHSIICTGL